ncbi:siderophore-interacting protein [Ancylobacter sp. FA202]|uniref:siderophore-interacting protein n=1 Tax=Ancylobacter sp. FA202 TaxID=1111106 RepID=UPI00035EEF23|nr:siderophore-interacting protein [Ancylobacter sp. FA202]
MNVASPVFPAAPTLNRQRFEPKRRSLTVLSTERVTPSMLRLVLGGDDLADFVSAAPDDHVKVVLVRPDGVEERRDYTPRRFDAARRELTLDFALHEAGPATLWALQARPGDRLDVLGPRGSAVVEDATVAHWLLIGDETALPAIGRRIEEAAPGARLTSLVAVTGAIEEQRFATAATLDARWIHRPAAALTQAAPFIAALETIELEPATYVWVAAEAAVARAVRAYLTERRGVPIGWIKAAGYWVLGEADAHEKMG